MSTITLGLAGAVVTAAVGCLVAVYRAQLARAVRLVPGAWRLPLAREHLVVDLGRLGAFALVMAAGVGLLAVIGWLLGLAAAAAQPWDWAVFFYFRDQAGPAWWTASMDVLTRMGNRTQYKIVSAVAAVVLAVGYRRRWWMPLLALACVFVLERQLRLGLHVVVDRGHPPTTLGTYPSGGCMRFVAVYGTILYLALRLWGQRLHVAVPAAVWVAYAVGAWIEGYSRTYTLRHWVSDAAGGIVLGALILAVMVTAVRVLDRPR